MPEIVLVEPKIPQNTGTIARLCAATNSKLVLVGDLGFSLSDKYLKRAGLDYWKHVALEHIPDARQYLADIKDTSPYLLSSKASVPYTNVRYEHHQRLIFGSETTGLPDIYKDAFLHRLITIPMANPNIRSLNLANSVSIVLYEAIRQLS
ncbi:MAG: tRNA (cytidine(34)-2'-O)-methyltransferase [Candidatus Margulisbacteria bacterium]|jgi:tRNA (cytidine/uridine-2'-O-)-methyltransferase|nr:tRNA (cytidine(34)-2'-O)-methyltransferase [Candidatus Margulisiibacteriota bacterium]